MVRFDSKFTCNNCQCERLCDKIYHLKDLPNSLIIKITMKNDIEGAPIELREYQTINLEKYVDKRYVHINSNKLDKDASHSYKLISLVLYSDIDFDHEEYITYSLDFNSHKWVRYSRFGINLVHDEEVYNMKFPYLLIYERIFEPIKDRSNIESQLNLSYSADYNYKDYLPITDYWIQKATSHCFVGEIQYDHYLCEHNGLKPCYKDIFMKNRNKKELDNMEQLVLKELLPKSFQDRPIQEDFSFAKARFDCTSTY